MKRIFGIDVGLFILTVAFMFSFFFSFSVTMYWSYGIVDMLENNPSSYATFALENLLFMILPSAISLAFVSIAYVWEIKSPSGILEKYWPLFTALGIFFIYFGILFAQSAQRDYLFNLNSASQFNPSQTTSRLSQLYPRMMLSYYLWAASGFIFALSPLFTAVIKMRTWIKEKERITVERTNESFTPGSLSTEGNVYVEKHAEDHEYDA